MFGLFAACVVLVPACFVWRSYKKSVRCAIDYPVQHPKWQKAIDKYKSVLNCHRCGIVFNLASMDYCEPSNTKVFHEFLYKGKS